MSVNSAILMDIGKRTDNRALMGHDQHKGEVRRLLIFCRKGQISEFVSDIIGLVDDKGPRIEFGSVRTTIQGHLDKTTRC